jgi:hypothetical protein
LLECKNHAPVTDQPLLAAAAFGKTDYCSLPIVILLSKPLVAFAVCFVIDAFHLFFLLGADSPTKTMAAVKRAFVFVAAAIAVDDAAQEPTAAPTSTGYRR